MDTVSSELMMKRASTRQFEFGAKTLEPRGHFVGTKAH